MYNFQLWQTSGHADHYKKNMFGFNVESQEFGLKPMNCPGHCLMFAHRTRSYRELPIRMADFGVLHRNEYSGALHGLTRVRRCAATPPCRVPEIPEFLGVLPAVPENSWFSGCIFALLRCSGYVLALPCSNCQLVTGMGLNVQRPVHRSVHPPAQPAFL